MTSGDNKTPKGTPLTPFARAQDDDEDSECDASRLGQCSTGPSFSSNFYKHLDGPTNVLGGATDSGDIEVDNEPHIAGLSPTFADKCIPPSSTERGHSMHDQNPEESKSEHPTPQDDAQSPTQIVSLSHYAPSRNRSPGVYQGQQLLTHHQYPHGSGYPGPHALTAPYFGMGHPLPQPFVYHGYHPAFSPPQAFENPFLRHSPYQTSQIYAQQPSVSPHTGQGTPGGIHPLLYYSSHIEYAYQQPGYHSSPLPLYPPQHGQASFQASVEPRQTTWWHVGPGPPVPSPPHYGVGLPHHPGFQQSYLFPLLPLIPSVEDSRHSSASAPAPLYASTSSHTSRIPFVQQGSPSFNSEVPGTESSPLTALEDDEENSNTTEMPLIRRSYHPRPPIQRSDWTMWVGNIPSDATSNELWGFFGQLPSVSQSGFTDLQPVVSVFLINRSSCAFINYDTEPHLNEAIEHFSGKPLRPNVSRCPKLLCRVRKRGDDLRTGVGAQRGTGLHTKWVKEQEAKKLTIAITVSGDAGSLNPPIKVESSLSLSSGGEGDERRKKPEHSSSSGSYTSSTTSSFFSRYFPRRFFILKSLTQHDLNLSVEKGLWATQMHNEGVLDRAFRTSQEVLLIFGVNKSGEFYGFARMAGPIQSGEQQIAWEARKSRTPSSKEADTPGTQASGEDISPLFLSPRDHRLVDESPAETLSTKDEDDVGENPISHDSSDRVLDTDTERVQQFSAHLPPFTLDPEAPKRRMRRGEAAAKGKGSEQTWGQSFKVEWLSTERLPFYRIKHIRNPWNHDREVKVSRDGTELEPDVGQRLIDQWHELATTPVDSGSLASPSVSVRKAG